MKKNSILIRKKKILFALLLLPSSSLLLKAVMIICFFLKSVLQFELKVKYSFEVTRFTPEQKCKYIKLTILYYYSLIPNNLTYNMQ